MHDQLEPQSVPPASLALVQALLDREEELAVQLVIEQMRSERHSDA